MTILAATVWLGLTIVLAVLIGEVGGASVAAARASSAADAAALAAAAADDGEAARLAGANGAEVTSIVRFGNQVSVTVDVDGVVRTATAELFFEPRPL